MLKKVFGISFLLEEMFSESLGRNEVNQANLNFCYSLCDTMMVYLCSPAQFFHSLGFGAWYHSFCLNYGWLAFMSFDISIYSDYKNSYFSFFTLITILSKQGSCLKQLLGSLGCIYIMGKTLKSFLLADGTSIRLQGISISYRYLYRF